MSRLRYALIPLVLASLLLGACSSGSGGLQTGTSSGGGGGGGKVPPSAQLRRAALTTSDLPDGFQVDQSSDDSTSDIETDNKQCQRAVELLNRKQQKHAVDQDFQRQKRELIQQTITASRGEPARFKNIVSTFDGKCGGKVDFRSGGLTGTIEHVDSTKIGDDTAAFRIEIKGKEQGVDVSLKGYTIAIRHGSVTSAVGYSALDAPGAGIHGTPPSLSDTEQLAKTADKKIADATS